MSNTHNQTDREPVPTEFAVTLKALRTIAWAAGEVKTRAAIEDILANGIPPARASVKAAQAEAAASEATAAVVSIVPAVAAPARVVGITSRVTYAAQVDDLMELVKAVAEGKAPLEAIEANTKFLGAQARAFKKAGPLYPGVTTVAETGIASRAA